MEKIILFNPAKETESLVKKLAAQMHIKVIQAEHSQYHLPLEIILEQKGGGCLAGHSADVPKESLMVLCGLSEKHLNRILFAMKQCQALITYKAVLTDTNRKWTPLQMLTEMERERAMYERGEER